MPLITVKDAVPTIPAGTYKATLIGITPKSLVTRYTKDPNKPDEFLEWSWDIQGTELRSLTTVASGPKSRINEYLVALLGASAVQVGAGFDEGDLVGKSIYVQVVIDEDGWSKIDRVMALPAEAPARVADPSPPVPVPVPVAAAAEAAPVAEAPDDLPF
jgi:hypothetical protein